MAESEEDSGKAQTVAEAVSCVNQLFAACDLNGSGFIEQEELRAICNELTSEELTDVFRQLDNDEDGKISLEEFADGFQVENNQSSCQHFEYLHFTDLI